MLFKWYYSVCDRGSLKANIIRKDLNEFQLKLSTKFSENTCIFYKWNVANNVTVN